MNRPIIIIGGSIAGVLAAEAGREFAADLVNLLRETAILLNVSSPVACDFDNFNNSG